MNLWTGLRSVYLCKAVRSPYYIVSQCWVTVMCIAHTSCRWELTGTLGKCKNFCWEDSQSFLLLLESIIRVSVNDWHPLTLTHNFEARRLILYNYFCNYVIKMHEGYNVIFFILGIDCTVINLVMKLIVVEKCQLVRCSAIFTVKWHCGFWG